MNWWQDLRREWQNTLNEQRRSRLVVKGNSCLAAVGPLSTCSAFGAGCLDHLDTVVVGWWNPAASLIVL